MCLGPAGYQSETDTNDSTLAEDLEEDLKRFGFDYEYLGGGKDGWDTEKEGGRCKLVWLLRRLIDLEPTTVVMVLDGYDVRVKSDPGTILKQWGALRYPNVIAGEVLYWPKRDLRSAFNGIGLFEDEDNPIYKYPCSGTFIATAGSLRAQLRNVLGQYPKEQEQDDQFLMQKVVSVSYTHLTLPTILRV